MGVFYSEMVPFCTGRKKIEPCPGVPDARRVRGGICPDRMKRSRRRVKRRREHLVGEGTIHPCSGRRGGAYP